MLYNISGDVMKRLICIIMILLFSCGCVQNEIYPPAIFEKLPAEDIYISFPSLEHGFCSLIDSHGKSILIGCGDTDDFPALYDFLSNRNVESLYAVILLSDNEECTGGLQKLCANYEISRLYVSEGIRDIASYRELVRLNSCEDSRFYLLTEGTRIYEEDGVNIDVLSSKMCTMGDKSLSVATLRVSYEENSIIIEGDADAEAERLMAKKYPDMLKADVLCIPHCGTTSLPDRSFLDCIRPKYAVIPVYGDKTPLFSLTQKLENSGTEIIRTDTDGSIVFITDGRNIKYHIQK